MSETMLKRKKWHESEIIGRSHSGGETSEGTVERGNTRKS